VSVIEYDFYATYAHTLSTQESHTVAHAQKTLVKYNIMVHPQLYYTQVTIKYTFGY